IAPSRFSNGAAMVSRERLYLTAAIVGAVVWLCCGTVIGMASFEYHGPVHKNLEGQDRDNVIAYSNLAFKVGGVWAVCGAVAGILIMARFLAQPSEAHFTPIPRSSPGRTGPKSLSELRTMPVAAGIGLVGSILLYLLFIKKLALPPKTTLTTVGPIIAVVGTTILSVSILPLSLKWGGGRR
ncbi:MAG: hypothetical protein JSV80_16795, partial [Acidobacteriota bacterium]